MAGWYMPGGAGLFSRRGITLPLNHFNFPTKGLYHCDVLSQTFSALQLIAYPMNISR